MLLEEQYVSKFDLRIATRLAAVACSDRVKSPFVGREAKLLQILQYAEDALHNELSPSNIDTQSFSEELIEERGRLEAFKGHLDRFVHYWNRLGWQEKEEVLSFPFDGGEGVLDGISAERSSQLFGSVPFFDSALQKMQANLPLAIAVRGDGKDGPKEKNPELKAFVREIKTAWEGLDNAPAFGTNFEVSADSYPDKRPESAAAKLVFEAARIIDAKYSGIDCQAAMSGVKSESRG